MPQVGRGFHSVTAGSGRGGEKPWHRPCRLSWGDVLRHPLSAIVSTNQSVLPWGVAHPWGGERGGFLTALTGSQCSQGRGTLSSSPVISHLSCLQDEPKQPGSSDRQQVCSCPAASAAPSGPANKVLSLRPGQRFSADDDGGDEFGDDDGVGGAENVCFFEPAKARH